MAGSRARRRRRPETPELQLNPEHRDTDTTDTPASTSALQPQPRDRSRKRTRRRSRAAKERSEEEKTARVDECIHGGGEEADETSHAKKKEDAAEEEEKMKDDDVAAEEEEEDDEVVSSAPSSPIRAPVHKYRHHHNPAYEEAFVAVEAKYKEKTARQMKLPTLDEYSPCERRGAKDPKPLPIHESERRAVLLRAAKFVVGVSSSLGGELLERCSGFWIDWDEDNGTGIVLTAADIISRYDRSCYLKKYYASDAQVIVHLRDDTNAKAHLLYHQQHYNLALFRVTVDQPVHLPSFNDDVQYAQEIFELGRDEHSYLRIGHGRVEYPNPTYYDGYHDMDVVGGHEDFQYSKGGPVIDFDGNVVGMINQRGSFMISSILLKCLHIWRKFRCIPRPHLGLHLCAIRLLDLAIAEKISVKCNIDEGLIVKEVSKESHAEKLGIRVGDVIECLNGEHIRNTFEFEKILLSTCEAHLERGNGHNSKMEIEVRVFHTRKGLRRIKTLVVDLSEHKEDIERVYYPFTIGEGVSASASLDQVSSD